MPDLAAVTAALAPHGLAVVGAFAPGPEDGAPQETGALLLIGGDGARLWPIFTAAPEAEDGLPDPLDRWSRRVIDGVAAAFGAKALYPFDGPPWHPFVRWAGRGEGSRPSPVKIPVSPQRGLWAGYRGALALAGRMTLPPVHATDPCLGCPAPCLAACPVAAFAGESYDLGACVAHADGPDGADCRDGCLVRRACPVAPAPEPAQRRFHMAAFLAAHRPGGT